MENNRSRTLPRWVFVLISVGGAWSSGIYVGKMSIEGTSTAFMIPTIGFAILAVIMAWGAISDR